MVTFSALGALFSAVLLVILYLARRKRRDGGVTLPPGSMGWPFIGDTLHLYSQDPTVFFLRKQKRYGDVFKSHILGCPCIMLASPQAARFVLLTHSQLFRPTYPKSKEQLIGPSAIFFHQGAYHARLRKAIRCSLTCQAFRTLAEDVSRIAESITQPWRCGATVTIFDEMKKFSFEVGALAIFGKLGESEKQELRRNYIVVNKGYNSFAMNLPGTRFRRALNARGNLKKILTKLINQKREEKAYGKTVLGFLMELRVENGEVLTDDQVADNIIGVLFAAQDTTASALTWIIKFLHDHPKILSAIKEEQEGVRKPSYCETGSIINNVILESLRMASVISFTFREAVADVEYNGYLIPKGWKVLPLFRNIHHNPEFFIDPQSFQPSRFQDSPKASTFLPFGLGTHACPGNELAMLEMRTMIHHLATNFRWEVEEQGDGIQYSPFPIPSLGLPTRFWRR